MAEPRLLLEIVLAVINQIFRGPRQTYTVETNQFQPPTFADFYELPVVFDGNVTIDDFAEIDPPRLHRTIPAGYNPFNLDNQIVPRIKTANSSVGFSMIYLKLAAL